MFMCISFTPGRPNPVKKVASCIWHRSDQSGTQELKWLDMSATPRDCCSSRYDKARREISSRKWPSKSFPSTVCSPCSPEEAPPLSNSREYWKLKLRDASMALFSAKCEGRHLSSEVQRIMEAQKLLVPGAGAHGGESRWTLRRRVVSLIERDFQSVDGTLDETFLRTFLRDPTIKAYVDQGSMVEMDDAIGAKVGGRLTNNQYGLLEDSLGVLPPFSAMIQSRNETEERECPTFYYACEG